MNADLLSPGFLIASPRLDGSIFERSVIVLVHHDHEGAMGFIVNKAIDVDFGTLLEMVDMSEDQISPQCYDELVYFGGPVRVEQLWVIRTLGDQPVEPEDIAFHPSWKVAMTSDSIRELATGAVHGSFRPYMGYTGWGPGQLEGEIAEGSWLMVDFDEKLMFSGDLDGVWQTALNRLGVTETVFAMMGKAGMA